MWLETAELARQFQAVHSGQLEIEQRHVDLRRTRNLQCLVSAAGHKGTIAVLFQNHSSDLEPGEVIIDTKDRGTVRHNPITAVSAYSTASVHKVFARVIRALVVTLEQEET